MTRNANRYWGDKSIPKSKAEFFNAVTMPAPTGTGTVATIRLYGPIDSWGGFWGISTKDVGTVLDALPDTVTEIILRLNSPGGEVFEGISILNMLRAHKASVMAVVDGLAASAASVIAVGCDETVMSPGTQMMIHSTSSIVWGNAAEMRKTAEVLEGLDKSLVEIYSAKGGDKDWATMIADETWMTAAEAVEVGLADRIAVVPDAGETETVGDDDETVILIPLESDDEPDDMLARARLTRFPNRAAAAAASHVPPATEPGFPNRKEHVAMSDILAAGLRERLGVTDASASDEQLLAAVDEVLAEQTSETITPPEGTVLMDAAALADLQAAANEGRQALATLAETRREGIVDKAVKEGRIAPSSRASWLASLEKDESGTAALLASLAPNTIPVAEIGNAEEPTPIDSMYDAAWGNEKKGA